jgi:hypothetical protein
MTLIPKRFLRFASATLALGAAAMFLPVEWRLPGPPASDTTSTTIASPRPSSFSFNINGYQARWNQLAVDTPDLRIQEITPLSPTLHHAVFIGAEALTASETLVDLFLFTDDSGDVTQVLLQCRGSVLDTQIPDLFGVYAAAAALGLDTVEEAAQFAIPIMGIELFPVIGYHSIDDESLITMRLGSVDLVREASPGLLAYRVRP